MKEKPDALHSIYIIDGVQKDHTPAQFLDSVSGLEVSHGKGGTIVDESLDPVFKGYDFDPQLVDQYLDSVMAASLRLPLWDAGQYTRKKVAAALMDSLWLKGHYVLGDLQLKAGWRWNCGPVGSMAAFYDSVEAAADYIDALGLSLCGYSHEEVADEPGDVTFEVSLDSCGKDFEDSLFSDRHETPSLMCERIAPQVLVPDPQSWIVYIPFDPCDFRLGGSLLAQTLGLGGGVSAQIADADYFIDCYEVVRELAEDGILLSAATVGEGGLIKAMKSMTSQGTGAGIDISDLMRAYSQKNPVRVLFGEVPGVIVQIRDYDFDYLDAELLLQDVAFFPLGHPVPGSGDVHVHSSEKTGIQIILESLMQNAEGED